MKNKKLFAILTLVCFMMTLMPVAAFAAATTGTVVAASDISTELSKDSQSLEVTLSFGEDGAATSGTAYIYAHQSPARQVATATVNKGVKTVTAAVPMSSLATGDMIGALVTDATGSDTVADVEKQTSAPKVTAAQMETYKQVKAENDAATATTGTAVVELSALVANDGDHSVLLNKAKSGVDFTLTAIDANVDPGFFAADTLFVWAKDENGNITSALTDVEVGTSSVKGVSKINNVLLLNQGLANNAQLKLKFGRAGVYTVYAGIGSSTATKIGDVQVLDNGKSASKITVIGSSVNPENDYTMSLNNNPDHKYTYGVKDGSDFTIADVTPNNVGKEVTLTFYNEGKKLTGKTVTIETGSANIAVSKTTATINTLGQVKFDLSASREGI